MTRGMAKKTAKERMVKGRDELVNMGTVSKATTLNRKKSRKGYRTWTEVEKDALVRGVDRYGLGKWQMIKRDPEFREALQTRTNVDLKDKWRCASTPTKSGVIRSPPLSPLARQMIEELRANGELPPVRSPSHFGGSPMGSPMRTSGTPPMTEPNSTKSRSVKNACVIM